MGILGEILFCPGFKSHQDELCGPLLSGRVQCYSVEVTGSGIGAISRTLQEGDGSPIRWFYFGLTFCVL